MGEDGIRSWMYRKILEHHHPEIKEIEISLKNKNMENRSLKPSDAVKAEELKTLTGAIERLSARIPVMRELNGDALRLLSTLNYKYAPSRGSGSLEKEVEKGLDGQKPTMMDTFYDIDNDLNREISFLKDTIQLISELVGEGNQ